TQLLDMVSANPRKDAKPNPAGDAFVRQWFRAVMTYMVSQEDFSVRLFAHAEGLFPDDPEILFLVGCRHEAIASPPIQLAMQRAQRRGFSFGIGKQREELQLADASFRRVLALRPAHAEARIRHGRILDLLGEHAAAAAELRAVEGHAGRPVLDYYGA